MNGTSPLQASLQVRVKPRASRPGLVGRHGKGVKVAVRAVPERGRANEEVLRVLAEALGIAVADVHIVAGETSQDKHVRIDGLDQNELERRLAACLGAEEKR